jgi:hypothetical protein
VKSLNHSLTCSFSRKLEGTIGKLSDKILLKIFCFFLGVFPQGWPRLVHICREWRRIVFASQEVLHLRLLCTHGTPVLETLHCWPTLPIIVQYMEFPDLDSSIPEDYDQIIAALKQPGRVRSIGLTVTHPLLNKLSAISEPFSELEELILLSPGNMQLFLPLTFQWGPRLRKFHMTRIAFPSFLWRLTSSRNLVDIQLHDISDHASMPPELLLISLSRMAQLQSLSLHFLPITNHTNILSPWTVEPVILPSLNHLDFRGMSVYLARFVATLDAPYLEDIKVVFFDHSISDSDLKFNISKLSKFIHRIEIHKCHCQARILSSEHAISTSLIQPGASMHLELWSPDKPLSVRLLHMALICTCFSDYLFNVEDLCIDTMRPSGISWGDSLQVRKRLWLDLIKSFRGVKWFHVSGHLSEDIACSLHSRDGRCEIVLPALHKLYIPQPGPWGVYFRDAVVSFMISRQLSGHPIGVEYEGLSYIDELPQKGTLFARAFTTSF